MTILQKAFESLKKKQEESKETCVLDSTTKYRLTESGYVEGPKIYTISVVPTQFTYRNWFSISLTDKEEAIELCKLLNKWANFSPTNLIVTKEITV